MKNKNPIFVIFSSDIGEPRHIITTPEYEQEVIEKYLKINIDILDEDNYDRIERFEPQIEVHIRRPYVPKVNLISDIECIYEFPETKLRKILA